MGKKVYVFLTLQRTPRMKQKGPLIVFVSQEKDKRTPFDSTPYLIPLFNCSEESATIPIANVSTFVRSPNTPPPPPPLTPRKGNTGETIANCCLDCGIELWLHKTIHFTTGFSWTVPL